jgi:hypothetical protein
LDDRYGAAAIAGPAPVAPPESWLLTTGWRLYHPLVSPAEVPAPPISAEMPDFDPAFELT